MPSLKHNGLPNLYPNNLKNRLLGFAKPKSRFFRLFEYVCCTTILFSGCAVGPKYTPPENNISDQWNQKGDEESLDDPVVAWWKQFDDPLLDRYIEMAALQNKDLARAEAAILQARALRDVAASRYFPQITTDLNAIKTYFSKNGPVYSASGAGAPSPVTGLPFQIQAPQIQNLFTALFDATWEIDLFGKIKHSVESAQAHIDSAIEERNGVLITTLAETARNYLELRAFQKQKSYIEENIQLLEQNQQIVKDQMMVGIANQIDLETIEALLADAKASLPKVVSEIYRSIYTLSLLTGNLPETLVDDLIVFQELPTAPDLVAVGLRSDLLRRRPDVRRAERELAAATADVGVAVAAFYPTFSLLGDAGLQSLHIKNLFESHSKTWAYGGDMNVPVYEGGKLVGYLHASRAAETMAFNTYQQTVLSALQNTESALIAYSEDIVTVNHHQEMKDHYKKITLISQYRYQKGLINQFNNNNAKLQLISAEETLLKSRTASLIDLVALYKALGGGWQSDSYSEEDKS